MTYFRQPNVQPQGFYNPWMPGPDIGRGVQGFMDRLQQQKMYQQQLEQQQWKRGITEQEVGQAGRGLELRERELTSREKERESIAEYRKKDPPQIQLAKKLVETGYIDDMGKSMALVMGLQKPEEVYAELENELKLKAKYRPQDLFDKRMSLGRKLVEKGLLDEGTLGMTVLGVSGLQPSLTPASIASNRRLIFGSVDSRMKGIDEADFFDTERVEALSNMAGIHLWAPIKYNQILQAKALNPQFVTAEELEYVKRIEKTKQFFDDNIKGKGEKGRGLPFELMLATYSEEELNEMDYQTIIRLYNIYARKVLPREFRQ